MIILVFTPKADASATVSGLLAFRNAAAFEVYGMTAATRHPKGGATFRLRLTNRVEQSECHYNETVIPKT